MRITPQAGINVRAMKRRSAASPAFYGVTAKAARAEMKKARDRLDTGAPVKDASTTVGDWLSH